MHLNVRNQTSIMKIYDEQRCRIVNAVYKKVTNFELQRNAEKVESTD